MWSALGQILGKLAVLLLAFLQGKRTGKLEATYEEAHKKAESLAEIARQDAIVNSANADSMRKNLDAALRRKRDSTSS
jgi:hypothetical protein